MNIYNKKIAFFIYTVHKFCLSNMNCSVDHSMKNRSVKKSVQLLFLAKIFIFEQGYHLANLRREIEFWPDILPDIRYPAMAIQLDQSGL